VRSLPRQAANDCIQPPSHQVSHQRAIARSGVEQQVLGFDPHRSLDRDAGGTDRRILRVAETERDRLSGGVAVCARVELAYAFHVQGPVGMIPVVFRPSLPGLAGKDEDKVRLERVDQSQSARRDGGDLSGGAVGIAIGLSPTQFGNELANATLCQKVAGSS